MTAILLAIDPGSVSGAYAVFFAKGPPVVDDIPVVDRQIDAAFLHRMVRELQPRAAVVENVSSMPKQGVVSTFRFGVAVGMIHGILACNTVPTHLVAPAVWKRSLGLIGKPKDAARAKAIQMYPAVTGLTRKMDVGRADALLMGHYWLTFRGNPVVKLWQPTDIEPDEVA
jgi:crossover junction endodeoxyribonuclease RuvC